MESPIYNMQGKKAGTLKLPESIFGYAWNADLVHQVVDAMRANARGPIAHTKGRGEVRGGGRKPWQQKGTGRARHGSIRSPIWRGGGITHGPTKEKIYAKTTTQKMRQKALLVVLSRKARDGEVIFIDKLELLESKTKQAKIILSAFTKEFVGFGKNKNAALIALPAAHAPTQKSFANFGNIEVVEARNLNPLSVLSKKYLVIVEPKVVFEMLGKKVKDQGSTLAQGSLRSNL